MHIDAHQHFWQIAERRGHWPPATLGAIHRDFAPADLQPALQRCGIDGTVLVQSLPSLADTEFMLALAQRHDFIRGVVGWVDLMAADAPTHIATLAQHDKFKGVRPMLQDIADVRWIDHPALAPAVQALIEHRLCFDALVLPRHLGALLGFARRHPQLPIVIDHAAKPAIAQGSVEPWHTDLAALALLPNVHCKLSGLLTEAGAQAEEASLRPYVTRLFNLFGAQRLMWGSDWPVLRLAAAHTPHDEEAAYDTWFDMAQRLCARQRGFDASAREAVFGGNAQHFYRLA